VPGIVKGTCILGSFKLFIDFVVVCVVSVCFIRRGSQNS
jgi:hypothetical protein